MSGFAAVHNQQRGVVKLAVQPGRRGRLLCALRGRFADHLDERLPDLHPCSLLGLSHNRCHSHRLHRLSRLSRLRPRRGRDQRRRGLVLEALADDAIGLDPVGEEVCG